jgi:hypothetical protein
MLQWAGGIGSGRSRTASAPDLFHFLINLVPIAATGQLLPSPGSTGSSRVKSQLGVASALCADFEPEARQHKAARSHSVAPSRTISSFILSSSPFCRADFSRQSLLATAEAKRRRVKACQTTFQARTLGRPSRRHYYILCVTFQNAQPMVFCFCGGHHRRQPIRPDQSGQSAIRNGS